MTRRTALLAVSVLLAATPIHAAQPPIAISDAWIRALPRTVPSGGYFVLHNNSDKLLTLTGASSPACGMLMLHKSEVMSGMAHMDEMANVDVPAHSTLRFAPGGNHLMCMNPSPAIKPGNTVTVTLQFADGSKLSAPFPVRSAAGR